MEGVMIDDEMTADEMGDDISELAELAGGLAPLELDARRAARIMAAAHEDLGRPPPRAWYLEPAAVTLLSVVYFAWAFSYILDAWGPR
jgi:hypothetical protein